MSTPIITAIIAALATVISVGVQFALNSRNAKTTTFTATIDGMQALVNEYKEQAKTAEDRLDRRSEQHTAQLLELTAKVNRCESEKDVMRAEFQAAIDKIRSERA